MVMALTPLPGGWRGGAGAERISCASCAEEADDGEENTAGDFKGIGRIDSLRRTSSCLLLWFSPPVTPSMAVPHRYSWSNKRIICFVFFCKGLQWASLPREKELHFLWKDTDVAKIVINNRTWSYCGGSVPPKWTYAFLKKKARVFNYASCSGVTSRTMDCLYWQFYVITMRLNIFSIGFGLLKLKVPTCQTQYSRQTAFEVD